MNSEEIVKMCLTGCLEPNSNIIKEIWEGDQCQYRLVIHHALLQFLNQKLLLAKLTIITLVGNFKVFIEKNPEQIGKWKITHLNFNGQSNNSRKEYQYQIHKLCPSYRIQKEILVSECQNTLWKSHLFMYNNQLHLKLDILAVLIQFV